MSSKYRDISIEDNYDYDKYLTEDSGELKENSEEEPAEKKPVINEEGEIGYPVNIKFIDTTKLYMQQIQWNWHDEIEIIIINHGQAYFFTNEKSVVLNPGNGVIINANQIHSIAPVNITEGCSLYSVSFHPAFIFGYGAITLTDKYITPVLASKHFRFITLNEDNPGESLLIDMINEIIATNLIKKPGYELITKSWLCKLWCNLFEILTPSSNKNKKTRRGISLDESRAKEIINYIEAHYDEKVTLDEIAEKINISKSECCRCFKRAINMTPVEYLMSFRIFKAASLIKNNDPKASSFSDLAYNVGFNNASYFNKVFKEFLNCTPSQYKKKLSLDQTFDPFSEFTLNR